MNNIYEIILFSTSRRVSLNWTAVFRYTKRSSSEDSETESRPVLIPAIVLENKISYNVIPPEFKSVRIGIKESFEQSQQ